LSGDELRYRRLETAAEQLYDAAEFHGVEHVRVSRLAGLPANTANCVQCGKEFQRSRSTARFCSNKCRQRHKRFEGVA
jgi:hypothetical protein